MICSDTICKQIEPSTFERDILRTIWFILNDRSNEKQNISLSGYKICNEQQAYLSKFEQGDCLLVT